MNPDFLRENFWRRSIEYLRRQFSRLAAAGKKNSLAINWLVPEPFLGAGGDIGLFRIIRHLAEFGHDCQVHVVPYNLMNEFSTEQIREYVHEHFGLTPATYHKFEGAVSDADCTFATFWPTAENLQRLTNSGRRYYLVQDFEPSFYPREADLIERAENTYRAGFHCITLGPWLAKLLREQYGATADHFDFAVDRKIYWPRAKLRSARRRLCFYARPSTPRRAYELGIAALELVQTRLPDVELVLFGAAELTPAPQFKYVNQGLLEQEDLATLFSSCDVGLVLSLTNPSFVPLEMMACRCAAVELASERVAGVLTHGKDAWLVQPNAAAIADGVVELLTNTALRERLIAKAERRTRTMSWSHSARQVERILLRRS